MHKKKIALVNVFFPPQSIGGATRVVADNFDVLIEKYSEEVELVIFASDVEMQKSPHLLDCYIYKGVRVYRTSVIFREHMDWHPKDNAMKELFMQFLDFEKPDYVHFHCIQRLTGSVVEAAKDKCIPYFITLHDAWWISDFQFLVDGEGKVYPDGHPDPKEKIKLPAGISEKASLERKNYLRSLLEKAEKLFSVSESFMDLYEKNHINNIVVTKNGISRHIKWKEKDTRYASKVICAHIGGMSTHKGFDILKEAVLAEQPQNLEFLVVDHAKGQGYVSTQLWGNVTVKFIGRVSQERIVDLYRRIDVLFAPSIWPESFGLVTREAAACGCWVVASDMGGIGEDVIEGETGFVVDPTVAGISLVLKELDKDAKIYKDRISHRKSRFVDEQVEELVAYYVK